MTNPFVLKLGYGADLQDDDRSLLERTVRDVREFGPRQDIIAEGDVPDNVHVVLDGFACRYKTLPDGTRQIMAYLVPGDMCDLHVAILGEMDHSIAALTRCRVAYISPQVIEELTAGHPRINRALWWATLVDEGTLREWLVGMGRRDAEHRLAHLICELLVRLEAVDRGSKDSFELPMTQEDLGDTLGLSTVHVNRVLQSLRGYDLITLKGKQLVIPDVERLKAFADFDANYLHLKRRPRDRRNGQEPPFVPGRTRSPALSPKLQASET